MVERPEYSMRNGRAMLIIYFSLKAKSGLDPIVRQPQRSLLADPEDLVIELGEFFEVGTDDLGFHHEIFVNAKLGKSLF